MYVAISQSLLQDVATKINGMAQAEEHAIAAQHKFPPFTGEEPELLKAVWGEHLHFKDELPPTWMRETMGATLRFKVQVEDRTIDYSLCVVFNGKLLLPPNIGPYGVCIVVNEKYPLFAPHVAFATAQVEAIHRWRKVADQIKTFLGKCKSLNEAIKLWPQIEMYIPEQYMRKVKEKKAIYKTESKASEALKDLDVDTLTASAVIARMSDNR